MTMDAALADDPNIKDLIWEARLIDKVKQRPQLYDFNHKKYKEAQKCNQTWHSIAKQLGLPGQWKMCKERWRTLRDVYVRKRKSFLVGNERGRWPKWKFFNQMNFLHSYICHRTNYIERTANGFRPQWEGSRSDSDSNEEPPLSQEAPLSFEDIKIEEEEEEEGERESKRARLSDDLATMQERDIENSAVEGFEAELSGEADPLSCTFDGQPIKQEVEWTDGEMDSVDKSLLKEASPASSPAPPTVSPPPPPPPPPPENKKLLLQIKLPGGKTIPATFITNTMQPFINKKVGMITPIPLRTVPIKIKTVTGSLARPTCLTSVVSSSPYTQQIPTIPAVSSAPLPYTRQPPTIPVVSSSLSPYTQQSPTTPAVKEDHKHTSSSKPPTAPTPCPEPVPEAADTSAPHESMLEDEEELYGRYIAAAIRKLTRESRSHAKMRIQQVIYDLEELDRTREVNGKKSLVLGSEK